MLCKGQDTHAPVCPRTRLYRLKPSKCRHSERFCTGHAALRTDVSLPLLHLLISFCTEHTDAENK